MLVTSLSVSQVMYGVNVVKEPGVAQAVKLFDVSGVAFNKSRVKLQSAQRMLQ